MLDSGSSGPSSSSTGKGHCVALCCVLGQDTVPRFTQAYECGAMADEMAGGN